MDATTQQQIDAFDALRGTKGEYADLAYRAEALGLEVRPDPDNNERSDVILPGVWNPDGSDVVIGEIIGDTDAEIR